MAINREDDQGLVSVDQLAEEMCRMRGYGGSGKPIESVQFGWETTSLQIDILNAAERGEVCLYCDDRPFPFSGGLNERHGGLRLDSSDVEKLRRKFLRRPMESIGDPVDSVCDGRAAHAADHDDVSGSAVPVPAGGPPLKAAALSLGVTPDAPQNHNRKLLATRRELIDAFGAFTGMDMSWFHNHTDSPALSRARKVTGIGKHGASLEPLYCPYEVMSWLINPKRRKGRELSPEKGWTILERSFQNVYVVKGIGDPRER